MAANEAWVTFQRKAIYDRYFRKVIKFPDGAVVHHGDCYWYSHKLCTCGLLHDLASLSEGIEGIYPNFGEEWNQQESVLDWISKHAHTKPG